MLRKEKESKETQRERESREWEKKKSPSVRENSRQPLPDGLLILSHPIFFLFSRKKKKQQQQQLLFLFHHFFEFRGVEKRKNQDGKYFTRMFETRQGHQRLPSTCRREIVSFKSARQRGGGLTLSEKILVGRRWPGEEESLVSWEKKTSRQLHTRLKAANKASLKEVISSCYSVTSGKDEENGRPNRNRRTTE